MENGILCWTICGHSLQHLLETADNMDGLPFKLHDFGCRGSTSVEVSTLIIISVHLKNIILLC